jgi:hypothetical protein
MASKIRRDHPIADWVEADGGIRLTLESMQSVQSALADVLALARRAGLEETARRLEDSLAALDRAQIRRMN